MSEENQEGKSTISITIAIKDKSVLYAAYMPFIDGGGLFIPTKKPFAMDQKLSVVLTLMNDADKYTLDTQVVWLTPIGSQGNRAPGVGLQFLSGDVEQVRRKIEGLLATTLQSEKGTHTL